MREWELRPREEPVEELMANKDKARRSSKKAASRTLKEKRAAKKAKRSGK